jgi:hypothetical protein
LPAAHHSVFVMGVSWDAWAGNIANARLPVRK